MASEQVSKDGIKSVDQKLDAAITATSTLTDTVAANEETCTDEIKKLAASIEKLKEDTETAAAEEVEVAASWIFLTNPIHPTNRRVSVNIEVIGKNLKQYDFSPAHAPFFKCTFTDVTSAKNTFETAGQARRTTHPDDEPTFDLLCPTPTSIKKKTTFQLSVEWQGGEDAVDIPFKGANKKDLITFDMTWSSVFSRQTDNHLVAAVDGLDIDTKYTCKFTQADNEDVTKSTDGAFVENTKGRKMDCGAQPTGFAIDGASAAVIFEVFVKGSKTKASYAGPSGEGPKIQLNTCLNGAKDGDEPVKNQQTNCN